MDKEEGRCIKYAADRPFADPDKAARKLVEIGNSLEPYMDGRLLVKLLNGEFMKAGGSPAEYGAGIQRAVAVGWLDRHMSGAFLSSPRQDLFV